jgi:hypothetical protein
MAVEEAVGIVFIGIQLHCISSYLHSIESNFNNKLS